VLVWKFIKMNKYSLLFLYFFIIGLVFRVDVYGQEAKDYEFERADTLVFEYTQNTTFMNNIQQGHRKYLYGNSAGTHIRYVSYGVGPNLFYFISPSDRKLNFYSVKGVPKYISIQPWSTYKLPHREQSLLFYDGAIFLVDKYDQMIKKWNHIKGYKGLYFLGARHLDHVHDYILGNIIYFDVQVRFDYISDKKVLNKYNISPTVAFVYTPLSDFLNSRKMRIQEYSALHSDVCFEVNGNEDWQKIIYADTIRNDLWYNSPCHKYLIRFNQASKVSKCFKLPEPIPPGLSYLNPFAELNKYNYISHVLKYKELDTIIQLSVFPLQVVTLPNTNKLLYSYYVVFDESFGDSVVLQDLHDNSLIKGKHWSDQRPIDGLFQIFQLFSVTDELQLDWQVMVPREHFMYPHSATETSITGISSVLKDNYFVPALITWHLK